MAEGGEEPNSLLEIVECDICNEVMVQPKALSCLHHFCGKCTGQFTRINGGDGIRGVSCPNCRQFTAERNIQNSILEKYEKKEGKKNISDSAKKCQQCNNAEAASLCQQCDMDICADCKERHLIIPTCKSHTFTTIGESDDTINILKNCAEHPYCPIRYSCIPCKSVLCSECIVESHKSHDTQSIEEAFISIQKQTSTHMNTINEQNKVNKEYLQKFTEIQSSAKEDHLKQMQKLNDAKTALLGKVECEYLKLKEKLDDQHAASTKQIKLHLEEIENRIASTASLTSWLNTVTHMTSGADRLTEVQTLFPRIEATSIESQQRPNLELESKKIEFQVKAIQAETNLLGEIVFNQVGTPKPFPVW